MIGDHTRSSTTPHDSPGVIRLKHPAMDVIDYGPKTTDPGFLTVVGPHIAAVCGMAHNEFQSFSVAAILTDSVEGVAQGVETDPGAVEAERFCQLNEFLGHRIAVSAVGPA